MYDHFVTEQGKAAAAVATQLMIDTQEPLLAAIRNTPDGLKPSRMFIHFPDVPKEVVREAMWQLLEADRVELTSGLALKSVG
jgi:hypothetical protein